MPSAKDKILALFKKRTDWTVVELTKAIGVTKQLVHRILKDLVETGQIQRLGLPPKTIYRSIAKESQHPSKNPFSQQENDYLKETFLLISETGEYLEGYDGFEPWCLKRKLPIPKTFNEFKHTKEKYRKYYNHEGWIDGTEKIRQTKGYDAIYLDQLFYLDFYAIERFGKTRLGTILHFAKQGQNKFLMEILLDDIKGKIEKFIIRHRIDAIGYIPPTIKREVQLIQFIRDGLDLNIPLVKIQKISGQIAIPQKSLNKLEERISNADNSFTIPDNNKYGRILLLDDAVGSGATLNQTAKKIKEKALAPFVMGLAIVGSFKGFDVITDV